MIPGWAKRISRGPLDAANSWLEKLASKWLQSARSTITASARRPGVLGGAALAAREHDAQGSERRHDRARPETQTMNNTVSQGQMTTESV